MFKLIILLSLLNLSLIAGDDYQASEIKSKVEEYLSNNDVKGIPLIKRGIKLPFCSKEINIKNKFGNYKTLELACFGIKKWSYTIRVKTKKNKLKKSRKVSKNNNLNTIIKLKKDIKRGHPLKEEDLVLVQTKFSVGSDTFKNINDLIGRKMKHSLRKDQFLRERHVEKNWLVLEGQPITIESSVNNILVFADGTVKKSAMMDEMTEVINDSSGKIVKALVVNNKKVKINR